MQPFTARRIRDVAFGTARNLRFSWKLPSQAGFLSDYNKDGWKRKTGLRALYRDSEREPVAEFPGVRLKVNLNDGERNAMEWNRSEDVGLDDVCSFGVGRCATGKGWNSHSCLCT
jgi:hypothetical protein